MPREWELSVEAPEIGVTKTLLVTGDMMIGEIIVKLATTFGKRGAWPFLTLAFSCRLGVGHTFL